MDALTRDRLARRRQLWRAVRDGDLPVPELPEDRARARRQRATFWWVDLEEDEGRSPPRRAPSPRKNGLAVAHIAENSDEHNMNCMSQWAA